MTQQLRAAVWKSRGGYWWAEACERGSWHMGADIRWCALGRSYRGQPLPTHAEALEAALKWVGLGKPIEHREAP